MRADPTPEQRLLRALRDEVFPAMQVADPAMARTDVLRLLVWLAALRLAETRDLVPCHRPLSWEALARIAWRTSPGDPAASPAARTGLAMLDRLAWEGVDARWLGDLYAALSADRRASGRYFTPEPLARWVAGRVGLPHARGLRGPLVLDPAMGCGHFLIAAAEALAGDGAGADRRWEALGALHGADRDPLAVELAGIVLWLWAGRPGTTPALLGERLRCGDTLRDDLWPDRPAGFDAVVGNPPYASVFTRARVAERDNLRERYASASGSYDLAVPFVERAVRLTRVGGRCGLVLPNKLLCADYARPLREWIGGQAAVEAIADATRLGAFSAGVYPVVCVFRRGKPDEDEPLAICQVRPAVNRRAREDKAAEAACATVRRGQQRDLRGAPGGVWGAALDPAFDALRVCWEGGAIPLGELATLHAGLTVGEAYALRESVFDAPPNGLPEGFFQLVTTGLIQRYGSRWGQARATYLRRTFRRPVIAAHALPPRRRAQSGGAKIVVAGMGLEPRAVVDRGSMQASVATVILTDARWPLDALCAWINSALVARLYRALFGGLALSGGYLRFGQRELSLLPIPAPPEGDPRLARLDALGRQAACGDERAAEIDALVRDLYGIDQ